MSKPLSKGQFHASTKPKAAPAPMYSGDVRAQLMRQRQAKSVGLAGAAVGDEPLPMALPYLSAYAPTLQNQVRQWFAQDKVESWLLGKYPRSHGLANDKALFDYVDDLRLEYLRNAGQIHRVLYDSKIHVVNNALGLHTRRAIAHGGKLNARHEIRVAAMFRNTPQEFLRMIVVHELAHLREMEHDRAFYQLCAHMEPQYHQFEFEVRLYLSWMEHTGSSLWQSEAKSEAKG